MSWDSLPQELLSLIFQCLTDVFDLYQCLRVSTSWRFAAKKLWRRNVAATTPPWLLIKQLNMVKEQCFITRPLSINSKMISTCLPTLNKPIMVHSSHKGWILLLSTNGEYSQTNDLISNMYLYNPLTRMLIELPELLPSLHVSYSQIKKFITSTSPTDANCLVFIVREDTDSYSLCFCEPQRHHKSTNNGWNTLCKPYMLSFHDIIFYKDKLLYATYDGDDNEDDDTIISGDTSTSNTGFTLSRLKLELSAPGCTCGLNEVLYPVESKTGELLVIERLIEQESRKSVSFTVYKVNWCNEEWEQVDAFTCDGEHGAQALFLAKNEAIFVSVEGEEEIKPNCIYFFDEFFYGFGIKSYGVYDLRSTGIERFKPSSPNVEDVTADWFRPFALL